MGVMCSDPGGRPAVHDRFTVDVESFPELDPGFSESEQNCTPSIRTVPISANDLRIYRVEKKKRDSFFDLDAVDEANEFTGKVMISDMTCNRNKPKSLTKANLQVRERKQGNYCLPRVHVKNQNYRMNFPRAGSVCSDKEEWKTSRAISVCSDHAVYLHPRAAVYTGKGSRQHTVSPRGYCTDEFVSACDSSDQTDYFMARTSAQKDRYSSKCTVSQREYFTDELSYNASIELAEKSESESDSLKFPRTCDEAREPPSEETLVQFRAIDTHTETSISPRENSFFKVKKLKPSTPHICTDTISLRSSGSAANDVYKRGDCRSVCSKSSEQRLKRDKNSADMIVVFQHPLEDPMLSCAKTTDDEVELDEKSQHTFLAGEINNKDEVEGGLIFTTQDRGELFQRVFQDTEDAESNNKNVALP